MAGAGYKLFNTGDVLTAAQVNTYLMEQSVMVFANAAARTTALSGVVAEGMLSYLKDTDQVEVYNGSAWVASDDPNAIQNSIVDAKGDLITATANDTPARLAVGNNGETLLTDSAATTGLRWQGNYAAGKNAIINGDFRINQRNFTSTSITGVYGFDRWNMALSGATATYSAETFTLGAAPVAGYESKNFARIAVTTGNDLCRIQQLIESVRTFAGQTVTLSFWAKGTNPTTAGNLKVILQQNFGTGGSPSTSVNSTQQTFVLTANWVRYSFTISLASISGKTLGTNGDDHLGVWIGQGDSISTDSWTLDIWGVQLEAGSVATAFQTATGTLAGELAACQRYYWRNTASAAYSNFAQGANYSTTAASFAFRFPVTMRVAPTAVEISSISIQDYLSLGVAVTSPALEYASKDTAYLNVTGVSGLTAFRPVFLGANNNSAAYVAFTAEL